MSTTTHAFLGTGKVFIGPADGSGPQRFLGEASKVELSFSEDKKTLKNYSTPGGGNAASVSLISDAQLNITAHGFDSKALAMATFGEDSAITGAAVTDEEHTAYLGGYLRASAGVSLSAVTLQVKAEANAADWAATTAYSLDLVVPTTPNGHVYQCTAAGTSDASEPTWPTDGTTVVDGTVTWVDVGLIELTEGTDFEIEKGGVLIPTATTRISDGDAVLLGYTHTNAVSVEAILNTGKEYRFTFDGLNQANDDKPVVVDVWRAKGAPSSLGLITDDMGGMDFSFEILKDESKTGSAQSKFFRVQQVE